MKKEENNKKQNQENENEDVAEEKEEEKKEEENELTVGSTFEKKGLKVTVNDVNLDFTDSKGLVIYVSATARFFLINK